MKLNGEEVGSPADGEVVAHNAHGGEPALSATEVPPGTLLRAQWAIGEHSARWYERREDALATLSAEAHYHGLDISSSGTHAERKERPGSPGSSLWVEPVSPGGCVGVS